MRDKAAAHESDFREAIEQSQFAHRIGNVNSGAVIRQFAFRAPFHWPRTAKHRDFFAAIRMPRHDDGQKIGMRFAQHVLCRQQCFVFARVRARCEEDGAGANRVLQRFQLFRIGGQGRRIGFQTSGHPHVSCAEGRKPCPHFRVDGKDAVERG
jgi:hypothetical protein